MRNTPSAFSPLDANDVLARYEVTLTEVQVLGLKPVRAATRIPGDASARRDPEAALQKYLRYVTSVTARNVATASYARKWWDWWEKQQGALDDQHPEPLVPAAMRKALHFESRRRAFAQQATSPKQTSATPSSKAGRKRHPKRTKPKSEGLDFNACAVVDTFEDPDSPIYKPDWMLKDVAKMLNIAPARLCDRNRDGRYRLPNFRERWERQNRRVATEKHLRSQRLN